ncbi:MAG: queuosine precursor transporter [Planctomycetes bacterium]|nr:queuosine precursor transporter [Planctomycetota bacterium]
MRERAVYGYLTLAGIFLGALVLCNLIVLKFFGFTWPSFVPFVGGQLAILSVGILPYPLTFLCTDLLSEIYGKKRADAVVWVGLVVSLLTLGWLQLAMAVPAKTTAGWAGAWTLEKEPSIEQLEEALVARGIRDFGFAWQQELEGDRLTTALPSGVEELRRGRLLLIDRRIAKADATHPPFEVRELLPARLRDVAPDGPRLELRTIAPVGDDLFARVFGSSMRAILASMIAYLFAQWFDIRLYHFWKRFTNGKHLWLRNNASTIVSQLLDSVLVITLLFAGVWTNDMIVAAIASAWCFKILCALADTPFLYLGVWLFRRLDLCPDPREDTGHVQPS